MSKKKIQWNINDTAYHPTFGLVQIFEMYLGFANVFPKDEDKWGTKNRIVNISELQVPEKP